MVQMSFSRPSHLVLPERMHRDSPVYEPRLERAFQQVIGSNAETGNLDGSSAGESPFVSSVGSLKDRFSLAGGASCCRIFRSTDESVALRILSAYTCPT